MSNDSLNTSRDDSEEESTDDSESGNEGDIESEDRVSPIIRKRRHPKLVRCYIL